MIAFVAGDRGIVPETALVHDRSGLKRDRAWLFGGAFMARWPLFAIRHLPLVPRATSFEKRTLCSAIALRRQFKVPSARPMLKRPAPRNITESAESR